MELRGGASQSHGERPQTMLVTVETWKKEDIYVTKSVTAVKEKISSKGCVCVIGEPGAGKSTALHHAAISLEREGGFIIYFIDDLMEILKYYDQSKKQVFVVDDVLGVHSLSISKLDIWETRNEEINNLLGCKTKLLVSVRTYIYKNGNVHDNNKIFLNECLTTDHVDFSDAEYKLDIDGMRGMLTHFMTNKGIDRDIIDNITEKLWPYTENDMSEMDEDERKYVKEMYTAGEDLATCFPLLCKVFVNAEFLRQNPLAFFQNPFPALKDEINNIKTHNKHQFCALVLCAGFDEKLNEDMFSGLCESHYELDEKDVELRNIIMTSCDLEGQRQLHQIKSALDSLVGSYVFKVGNVYQMSHVVFKDVVTFVYDDPLFVFRYGSSEFIRDRVRLNKDQHDPYIIVYTDSKNIERLADRLLRDLKSDPVRGAEFIAENPNIGDDRLISCLRSILSDKKQIEKRNIDDLFRMCMGIVWAYKHMHKNDDVVQYKLIELCLQTGADCNMNIYNLWYPLHIAVMTESIQLTKLLLNNGADKRRIDWNGLSVINCVRIYTRYNKSEIYQLLTQHGSDQSVVKFITSDKQEIVKILECDNLQVNDILTDDSDNQVEEDMCVDSDDWYDIDTPDLENFLSKDEKIMCVEGDDWYNMSHLQLEEVLSDNSIKVLTTDRQEMKHYIEHCSVTLQLVNHLHDNILIYREKF